MDGFEELQHSLSEEELEQAAMAGLLTPRQKRLLNIAPSLGVSRGSSPSSVSMSGSPYYAPPQRHKTMAPANRAFAYSSVRVASAGLDAMAQADSWSRSSYEEAGFHPSYFLASHQDEQRASSAGHHSPLADASITADIVFPSDSPHGTTQDNRATARDNVSTKMGRPQRRRNAHADCGERHERRGRLHSDADNEPTAGLLQGVEELQRKRPKIGTPLLQLASLRASSREQ